MKITRALKIISSLAIVASAALARADVLFIDMNNSVNEMAYAEAAAKARGERLIRIPPVTPEKAQELVEVSRTLHQAGWNKSKACAKKDSVDCQAATKAHRAAIAAKKKVASTVPRVSRATLTKYLKNIDASGARVSSVVLSGHDGNGWFGGGNGNLYDGELRAAMNSVPRLRNGVGSLYLWGCYTTTRGGLEYKWKGVFPGAKMVAGFDGRGPDDSRKANWTFLKDLMVKEKPLTEARSTADAEKLVKGLDNINNLTYGVYLDCNGSPDTLFNSQGTFKLKEEMAKCPTLDQPKTIERFWCYQEARPGCEDVPADTTGGELRKIYKYVHDTFHCDEVLTKMGSERPLPDEAMRLLFDKSVRYNLERFNRTEFKRYNDLIRQLGLGDHLLLQNLSKLTRKQWLDKINGLKAAYNELSAQMRGRDGKVDDPRVLTLGYLNAELSKVHDYRFIPEAWHDEDAEVAGSFSERFKQAWVKGKQHADRVRASRGVR